MSETKPISAITHIQYAVINVYRKVRILGLLSCNIIESIATLHLCDDGQSPWYSNKINIPDSIIIRVLYYPLNDVDYLTRDGRRGSLLVPVQLDQLLICI